MKNVGRMTGYMHTKGLCGDREYHRHLLSKLLLSKMEETKEKAIENLMAKSCGVLVKKVG